MSDFPPGARRFAQQAPNSTWIGAKDGRAFYAVKSLGSEYTHACTVFVTTGDGEFALLLEGTMDEVAADVAVWIIDRTVTSHLTADGGEPATSAGVAVVVNWDQIGSFEIMQGRFGQ